MRDSDQARHAVSALAQSGVFFIKVHDWLSHTAYMAIAENARAQGLPLVGHIPAALSVDDAIEAGQKSIEHMGGLTHGVLRGCARTDPQLHDDLLRQAASRVSSDDEFWAPSVIMSSAFLTPLLDAFDPELCAALAGRLAHADVWQAPTLVLWRAWATLATLEGSADDRSARRRLFETYRHMVGILAGTDEIPGVTIHDELELLVSSGLTPAEALRTATVNGADFLGLANSRGSIAPGHVADVILVDGNPLADIANLRHIRAVVLQGEYYETESIASWIAQ